MLKIDNYLSIKRNIANIRLAIRSPKSMYKKGYIIGGYFNHSNISSFMLKFIFVYMAIILIGDLYGNEFIKSWLKFSQGFFEHLPFPTLGLGERLERIRSLGYIDRLPVMAHVYGITFFGGAAVGGLSIYENRARLKKTHEMVAHCGGWILLLVLIFPILIFWDFVNNRQIHPGVGDTLYQLTNGIINDYTAFAEFCGLFFLLVWSIVNIAIYMSYIYLFFMKYYIKNNNFHN